MNNIYCKIAIVLLSSILLSCKFEATNSGSSNSASSTKTQSLYPIESKSSNISFDGTEFQKTSFATVIPNGKTATIPSGNCTLTGYVFVTGTTVKLDMKKNGYRLPTEAEWEYAARGAGITAEDWKYKYSGNDKIKKVAWCSYNSTGTSDEIEEGITHEVGIKKPNALYLYDMSGNTSEWCQDFYLNCITNYGSGNIPTGLEANSVVPEKFESNTDPYLNTPSIGGGRVKRGGSYADTNELYCRENQYEYWDSTEIGIRLVRRPYDNE